MGTGRRGSHILRVTGDSMAKNAPTCKRCRKTVPNVSFAHFSHFVFGTYCVGCEKIVASGFIEIDSETDDFDEDGEGLREWIRSALTPGKQISRGSGFSRLTIAAQSCTYKSSSFAHRMPFYRPLSVKL